jgi:type IV pilus assembly protein PilE
MRCNRPEMAPMTRPDSDVSRQTGFTLLEVMITVAIVGILAAIALPSYSQYITRSRIVDATAKLSDYRQKMEQYFLDNRTYVNGWNTVKQPASPSDAFAITAPTETANSYTLQADGMAAKGMTGFRYTIDQAGLHVTAAVPTGWSAPSPNTCWATRKDGTCG